ncbi:STAS domain-containing protein [Streptomyces sp. NPDC059534]|uniref:STAS domain-containing protein n=1 Tax=Streptomyces sp. NPDC059534 TaxID=3346859 RepID=UPI0036CD8103
MRADELLQVHSLRYEDTVLLCMTGELDLATAPLVDRAVTTALSSRPRHLCLDLTGLVFCDMTGLHALERLSNAAHATHANLHLAGLHPHLQRTLHLLKAASPWPPPVPHRHPQT